MESAELEPGVRLGKYEIVAKLGDGGMGVVYEARHVDLRQPVALKVLNARLGRDEVARERMLREGRAAARIRHPNIVLVHDGGFDRGLAYLVMEKLEGEDLASYLRREGAMSLARVADLVLPVIAAIHAAHRVGVIHRDLKPNNVFLTRTPGGVLVPKVVDFGISKLLDATFGLTRTAEIIGTPAYMAPEQIAEAKDVDARADIYAIGVMLYECATGRQPFEGRNPLALLQAVGGGRFPAPREIAPLLPETFEQIVLRCMQLDPADRYASAIEVADALLEHASDAGRARFDELDARRAGMPPPVPTAARALAATRRAPRPLAWAIGVGAVLAVVTTGAVLHVASEPTDEAPSRFRVQVTTDPVEAEIALDGEARGRGAIDLELPRDGREHVLTVRASEHEPAELRFRDEPPPARVVLAPVAPPPPPRARTRERSRAATSRTSVNPAPSTAPERQSPRPTPSTPSDTSAADPNTTDATDTNATETQPRDAPRSRLPVLGELPL